MCLWYPHHRGVMWMSLWLSDTPSTVSLCAWSLTSRCVFLPSRSLERCCPQRHKPSTWWWEQLAISYDRSAVPGRSRWPPEAWLLRSCYPPHRPSRLWCTYWIYSAGPFSERSAAPLPSVEHCGWAEMRRLVVKKGKKKVYYVLFNLNVLCLCSSSCTALFETVLTFRSIISLACPS